jgi:hypothetical protein
VMCNALIPTRNGAKGCWMIVEGSGAS